MDKTVNTRWEELYPEEQLEIEIEARRVLLFAAEYGGSGVEWLVRTIGELSARMDELNDA